MKIKQLINEISIKINKQTFKKRINISKLNEEIIKN